MLTFGQLLPELLCEEFTMQFLNMYGCNIVVRLALLVEYVGICHFSWLLYETMLAIFCNSGRMISRSSRNNVGSSAGSAFQAVGNVNDIQRNTNDATGHQEACFQSIQNNDSEVKDHSDAEAANAGLGMELISGPALPLHVKELNWFDYLKYFWSTSVSLGSIVVVIIGIYNGYYVLEISVVWAYVLLLVSLTLLFYLEGLMVAIAGTQYWEREMFREDYPRAFDLHEMANKPYNVKRFMIGRQFCTVLMCFVVAEVSTFPAWPQISGISPILHFIVFRSGLVGVFIVLSFGQLMPELVAAEYPLRFMNIQGSYSVVFVSLLMESVGVGHCAWILYSMVRNILWAG